MSSETRLLKQFLEKSNTAFAILKEENDDFMLEYANDSFRKLFKIRRKENGFKADRYLKKISGVYHFLKDDDSEYMMVESEKGLLHVTRVFFGNSIGLQIEEAHDCKVEDEFCNSMRKAIFQDSLQTMVIIDINGTIMDMNERARYGFRNYLGIEAEVGTNLMEYLNKDYINNTKALFKRVFKGKTVKEEWVSDIEGKKYYAKFDAIPLYRAGEVFAVCIFAVDVTAERIAAKKLMEKEHRYQSLVSFSSDIITILAPDGRMKYGSPSANRILGYDVDKDLVGRNAFEFIHPDDMEPVMKVFSNEMQTPGAIVSAPEFRFKHKDGHWVPLESVGVNKTDDPAIKGMVVNSRDISERRCSEQERESRLMFLQTLINTTPMPIFYMNNKGIYEGCNSYFEEYIGFREEEMVGKTVYDIAPPELAKRYEQLDAELFKNGGTQEYQTDVVFADGTMHQVMIHKAAFMDSVGNIAGLVGVLADITEIKAMQKRLQEEKDKISVTLRSIGEGVIATDSNNKVILVNKYAEGLIGISENKAFMRNINDVLKLREMHSGKPIEITERDREIGCILTGKNNNQNFVTVNASSITGKGNKNLGTVIVIRDITEKIRMEEELIKTEKLESLGVLAGGIAHDFNNILTIIVGNLSLTRRFINDRQKAKEFLDGVERGTLRAKTLTQQLLTFSKGGAPLRKKESMKSLITDSVDFAMSGSKLKCSFDIPDDLWAADVDAGQMNQVINNLVINAEQAMPKGGTIYVSAKNSEGNADDLAEGTNNFVRISIRDEGIGIPEEYISKIFDPFFTTKQSGSGLGLSTVYSIIKKHDGYITVNSQPGKGTEFILYLPAAGIEDKEDREKEKFRIVGHGKVLMMDDDEQLKDVAKDMFEALGVKAEFASNGEEAIKKYRKTMKETPFDLVILDLTIPGGMGGKETMEELLKLDENVKAVVSSGYSNDKVLSHYKDYGFHGILQKPYQIDELNAILLKFIK